MEKINYSELLQPVIEEIQKDIEADKRGFDEVSNVLLVLSAQTSTDEEGESELKTAMLGNGSMLALVLRRQMEQSENFAELLQIAVDSYRKNRK